MLLPATIVTTPLRVVCKSHDSHSLSCAHRPYAVIIAEKKLVVGKRFSSSSEVESALNNQLRKDGHHQLRVYNSQKGEDYNRKRLSRKYPGEPVDVSKFQYTYYSVRCVHYGQPRHHGKGPRSIQWSFSFGCQAKITLAYNKGLNYLVVREYYLHQEGFRKTKRKT